MEESQGRIRAGNGTPICRIRWTGAALIGSVAVQADSDLAVFRLTDEQSLSFRVRDHAIMHLNATVTNVKGEPLLDVVDNHVFDRSGGVVEVAQRPGKFRMTAPVDTKLLPLWSLRQMRVQEPDFRREEVLHSWALKYLSQIWLECREHGSVVDGESS